MGKFTRWPALPQFRRPRGPWKKDGQQGLQKSSDGGRVPGGAVVERSELSEFVQMLDGHRCITLSLRQPSFSTAERIGK